MWIIKEIINILVFFKGKIHCERVKMGDFQKKVIAKARNNFWPAMTLHQSDFKK